MKIPVKEWSIGFDCDHEQYWQGHGIAGTYDKSPHTSWTHSASGCGDSLREAAAEAVDDLIEQDVEVTPELENEMITELASQIRKPYDLDTDITVKCRHPALDENDEEPDCAICAGEWHFYVNIDVRSWYGILR